MSGSFTVRVCYDFTFKHKVPCTKCGKSNPQNICCFLSNRLESLCAILCIYVTFISTLNCQAAFNNLAGRCIRQEAAACSP